MEAIVCVGLARVVNIGGQWLVVGSIDWSPTAIWACLSAAVLTIIGEVLSKDDHFESWTVGAP